MFSNPDIIRIQTELKDIWKELDRLKAFDTPSQANLDDRPINLNEFFSAVASDIGGIYKVMTETEAAAGTVVSSSITSATTTNCFNFATVANSPHLTRLVSGFYDIHAHLLKTGTRNVTAYCELYKRSSGGTETLLGSSPSTGNLTASDTFYDVYINLGVEVVMLITDRLVLKWYMITDGAPAGSGTTMTMTVGGTADPHLSVEIQTQELNNIFVLKAGDTMTGALIAPIIGVGVNPALGKLEVWGPKTSSDIYNYGIFVVHDTTAFSAGVGGAIAFSGYIDAVPNQAMGASIAMYKINSTSGDSAFGLKISTKANGANPTVKLTIDHLGNVKILSLAGAGDRPVYAHSDGTLYC